MLHFSPFKNLAALRAFRQSLIAALLAVFATVLPNAAAEAVRPSVTLSVEAPFVPTSGIGIVMARMGNFTASLESLVSRGDGRVQVRFALPNDVIEGGQVAGDLLLSALVTGPKGEIGFSPVTTVAALQKPKAVRPVCPLAGTSTALLEHQTSTLEALIDVRTRLRAVAQLKLTKRLTPDAIEKLGKLERGFGFRYSKPLSADLEPMEMIERISNLIVSIRSYRSRTPPAVKANGEPNVAGTTPTPTPTPAL